MSGIRIEDVTVRYDESETPAVDGVSLSVSPGELVVLLGPSGCGKTTLLKTVNRLVEPADGRVLLEETDVRDVAPTELRRRIGYVIQETGLFPHMRVRDNIAVVPKLLGWPSARIDQRVDELLELLELGRSYRERWPSQLSGGQAQRVGIARALAADPGYLLMDEPFGALDAITRARLQGAPSKIQARLEKTILFVTHDVDEALGLGDRVAVLRDGRLVQHDRPLALLTHPADAFVADLVGAADVTRQLGLLSVDDAMTSDEGPRDGHGERESEAADRTVAGEVGRPAEARAGSDAPDAPDALRPDTDLSTALSRLLRSEDAVLPVVDASGRWIGR